MIKTNTHRAVAFALALASAACGDSTSPGTSSVPPPGAGDPPAASMPKVTLSQISTDPGIPAGEAWVMVNPVNPLQVLAIWLGTRDQSSPVNTLTVPGYCGVSRSADGGETWSEMTQPFEPSDPPICGDPIGGVAPDGTVYIAADQIGASVWTPNLTSTDWGETWSARTEIFGLNQMFAAAAANPGHRTPAVALGRAFMAVDQVTGEISVHSQEDGGVEGRWLSVSSDKGATWSAPRPLDPDIQSSTAGPHDAAGGVIGVVYNVDPGSPQYLLSPVPAIACDEPCTIFETTRDQGVTWDRHVMPITVPSVAVGPSRAQVAADPSPRRRFAVLFNYDSTMEIWLTDDLGTSWEKARTLSAPEEATFGKPWITFAANGTLGVVWRYQFPDGSTWPTAIVSRDGGHTYSVEVPLTPEPTTASTSVTPGDDCACNLQLDATTLSATWTDTVTGQRQMYFGRFDYTNLPLAAQ